MQLTNGLMKKEALNEMLQCFTGRGVMSYSKGILTWIWG
ncbi:hypothetical protein BCAH1134_C0608 (plasmid) [Bacillus cereus AH1134]|nr:hypothetical protein BCAH1134_C0608 [Bacillus cereus AH1134]